MLRIQIMVACAGLSACAIDPPLLEVEAPTSLDKIAGAYARDDMAAGATVEPARKLTLDESGAWQHVVGGVVEASGEHVVEKGDLIFLGDEPAIVDANCRTIRFLDGVYQRPPVDGCLAPPLSPLERCVVGSIALELDARSITEGMHHWQLFDENRVFVEDREMKTVEGFYRSTKYGYWYIEDGSLVVESEAGVAPLASLDELIARSTDPHCDPTR